MPCLATSHRLRRSLAVSRRHVPHPSSTCPAPNRVLAAVDDCREPNHEICPFVRTLIVLLAITGLAQAESFTIVRDRQPEAEIVIAEQPARLTKLAAKDLQHYVEKISGAKLPVVTAPSGGATRPIYVGRSKFTDELQITPVGLEHGAFRIVARPDVLVLLGKDADFTPKPPHNRHNGDIARATAEWDQLTARNGFAACATLQIVRSSARHLGARRTRLVPRGERIAAPFGRRWFMPARSAR